MNKKIASILSICLFAMFAFAPLASADKSKTIVFAVQSVGTAAYARVAAMAQIMDKALPAGWKTELLPISTGGIAGTLLVEEEKALLGIGVNISNKLLREGQHPGVETLNTAVGLIGGTDFPYGMIMFNEAFQKKTGFTSLEKLVAAKQPFVVVTKAPGSAGEIGARQMLEVMNVTYDDIRSWGGEVYNVDPSVMSDMLREGKADVSMDVISLGQPAMTELTLTTQMYFPKLEQSTIEGMKRYGYVPRHMPANSWNGQKEELPTFGTCETVVASKKLPDDIAYAITKAVCEGRDELVGLAPSMRVFDPTIAGDALVNGLPLHPGAERYYREKGYLK